MSQAKFHRQIFPYCIFSLTEEQLQSVKYFRPLSHGLTKIWNCEYGLICVTYCNIASR